MSKRGPAMANDEVHGHVVRTFTNSVRANGVRLEPFLEGLRFGAADIEAPGFRAHWNDYALLCDRVFERVPREVAERIGASYGETHPLIRLVAQAVLSPYAFHRVVAEGTRRVWPFITFSFRRVGRDRVRWTANLAPRLRGSYGYFWFSGPILGTLTRQIGLPAGKVDTEIGTHHGNYLIQLPPSKTLVARGRVTFDSVWQAVVGELATAFSSGERREDPLAGTAARWRLSGREQEVVALLARGETNKEIAAKLGCAEVTIEFHITSILSKSKCRNRTEIVAAYWRGR